MYAAIDRGQGRYRPLESYESDTLEEENNRGQNGWREFEQHRTVFSRQEKVNPSFQVKGSRTQIQPWQMSIAGGHIGAIVGGFLGSLVPGIGSAIGAAVGGIVGSIVGGVIGFLLGN